MQEPKICSLNPRTLIGMRIQTTLAEDETQALWQAFKPREGEIKHRLDATSFYSVQVYAPGSTFADFTPQTRFEKWAGVEVAHADDIPEGMAALVLPAGKYAVFTHRGPVSTFSRTLQYIFGTWLPNSDFTFIDSPQFEIMGKNYLGPEHPDSEEEVWVPVE